MGEHVSAGADSFHNPQFGKGNNTADWVACGVSKSSSCRPWEAASSPRPNGCVPYEGNLGRPDSPNEQHMTMSHQQNVRVEPLQLRHPIIQIWRNTSTVGIRGRRMRQIKAYPFTLNLHPDWQASKIGLLSTAQLTGGKTARCLGDLAETRTPPRIITVPNGVIMVTLDDDGRRGHRMIRGSRGARPDCREWRRG